MWTGLEVSRAWEESPGELQSSASYCKVLHNLGQGPRVVLAWLIADGPASTPRSPPRLGHTGLNSQSETSWGPQPTNSRLWGPHPCQSLRGHRDPEPEPGPGPASCLKLFGTKLLNPSPGCLSLSRSPGARAPELSCSLVRSTEYHAIHHTYQLLFISNFVNQYEIRR